MKKHIRLIICILSFHFLLLAPCFAQKEYNYWYFGMFAGILFDGQNPQALLDGALITGEGCASISDSSGKLLFYTNGVKVFDRTHALMPGGDGLGGSTSTTQSALIIPMPLCARYYYLFTLAPQATPLGLRYSMVDMHARDGLGDVVEKNIPLLTPCTEKLTAIRHENGIDIWIITHGWKNNHFHAYRLGPSGLDQAPVVSACGRVHGIYGYDPDAKGTIGYLKPSPDGKLLAAAVYSENDVYQLFRFNNASGVVSDPVSFFEPNDDQLATGLLYGLEFSPDGKFLYTKKQFNQHVNQFSLANLDSAAISDSRIAVGAVNPAGSPQYNSGSLQLGPDQKIYIALLTTPYLACIHSPNSQGVSCQLVDTCIDLSGRNNYGGLPNNPFTAPYIQFQGCYTGEYRFHLAGTTPYLRWDFGDPGSLADTSRLKNPLYTFSQPGLYTVSVAYLTGWNTLDTARISIPVNPIPDLIAQDTLVFCQKDTGLILPDPAFDYYLWNTGDTTEYLKVTSPGTYHLTASDCRCSISDSVVVLLYPELDLLKDTLICNGEPLALALDVPGAAYQWSQGSTSGSVLIIEPGIYWVELSQHSCTRRDSLQVSPLDLRLDLGEDAYLCQGERFTIKPTGNFDMLWWSDGYPGVNREVTQPVALMATASKETCLVSDSILIKACPAISFPNVFTPNADQVNDLFLPEYNDIEAYHLYIYDRWGTKIFYSDNPGKGWDGKYKGQDCHEGSYFYTASFHFRDATGLPEQKRAGVVMLLR